MNFRKAVSVVLAAVMLLLLSGCSGSSQTENAARFGYYSYPNTEWGMDEKDVLPLFGKTEADLLSQSETDTERIIEFNSRAFRQECRIMMIFGKTEALKGLSTVKVYLNDADTDEITATIKEKLDNEKIPYKMSGNVFTSKNTIKGFSSELKEEIDLEKLLEELSALEEGKALYKHITESPLFLISVSKAEYSEIDKLRLPEGYFCDYAVVFSAMPCTAINNNLK